MPTRIKRLVQIVMWGYFQFQSMRENKKVDSLKGIIEKTEKKRESLFGVLLLCGYVVSFSLARSLHPNPIGRNHRPTLIAPASSPFPPRPPPACKDAVIKKCWIKSGKETAFPVLKSY